MFTSRFKIDGLAISLSFICAVHCLFTPSFVILAPTLLSISFDNEFIHYLILILAIPVSVFALSIGFKSHKSLSMVFSGFLGISILLFAVLIGNNLLGETGEKALTLLGSVIVAFAHFRNLKVCKQIISVIAPMPAIISE